MSGAAKKMKRKKKVLARDGWACRNCGATHNLTVDHVRPKSAGGTNVQSNLQCLCRSCHDEKDFPRRCLACGRALPNHAKSCVLGRMLRAECNHLSAALNAVRACIVQFEALPKSVQNGVLVALVGGAA